MNLHDRKDKPLRDMKNVLKYGRIILVIDENGNLCERLENNKFRLNIIAIIDLCGRLLLEIGLWRARPYRVVRYKSRLYIARRAKKFFLTKKQYQNCRKYIFEEIKKIIEKALSKRSTTFWNVCSLRIKFSRSKVSFYEAQGVKSYPVGIRFSLARRDEIIFQDFLRLELTNPHVIEMLFRLSRSMDRNLFGRLKTFYSKSKYSTKEVDRMLSSKRSGVAATGRIFQEKRLLPHHLWFVLRSGHVFKKELLEKIIENIYGISLIKLEEMDEIFEINGKNDSGLLIYSPSKHKLNKSKYGVFEITIPEFSKLIDESKKEINRENEEPF